MITQCDISVLPSDLQTKVNQVISQVESGYALAYSWNEDSRKGYLVRFAGFDSRFAVVSETGKKDFSLVNDSRNLKSVLQDYFFRTT